MKVQVNIRNLPVNVHKCATCPFGNNTDRTLQVQVIERCFTQQTSQVCHGTEGPNREPRSLCRGMRDVQLQIFHRMGLLDEPTDEAWEKARSRIIFG